MKPINPQRLTAADLIKLFAAAGQRITAADLARAQRAGAPHSKGRVNLVELAAWLARETAQKGQP